MALFVLIITIMMVLPTLVVMEENQKFTPLFVLFYYLNLNLLLIIIITISSMN